MRTDETARRLGGPTDLVGATAVAEGFRGRTRGAQLALIDGTAGAVWAPGGKVVGAFRFTVADGRIRSIDFIADPDRVAELDVTILGDAEALDEVERGRHPGLNPIRPDQDPDS